MAMQSQTSTASVAWMPAMTRLPDWGVLTPTSRTFKHLKTDLPAEPEAL